MSETSSFESRIKKTEELISFLNGSFSLEPESDSQEWPRAYRTSFHEKKYKAIFSIFGSFTLIPADSKSSPGTSPIYYLSLDTNSSNALAWTKPSGEFVEDSKQIIDELIRHIQIYEVGISEINSSGNRI
ncbi:hypothetical protein A0128_01380 [Leptospira tipperaryensis]|uniref:Uncharacterized protein n=1 Tax=Leptospira tipperaryensis TaxID=2564040 RepID=A0A1D7USN0_9LEPT|nr:hypothetical protein [Leptospira tipperaryensis]AOP32639.1 hypothetical protein A0128_01380 [Leptospira tipperaryensis]